MISVLVNPNNDTPFHKTIKSKKQQLNLLVQIVVLKLVRTNISTFILKEICRNFEFLGFDEIALKSYFNTRKTYNIFVTNALEKCNFSSDADFYEKHTSQSSTLINNLPNELKYVSTTSKTLNLTNSKRKLCKCSWS